MTQTAFEGRARQLVARMSLEEKVSQMVYAAPAIERLGIPSYNWWNEALHGLARAGVATVFPQSIGLGASWNDGLVQQIATAISDEARAKHHAAAERGLREMYVGLTHWSPNANLLRDPRWGRAQETYGEDPYLTARLGVAFVKGLQGDDPDYLKLVATPKHFAVHSGPESTRHEVDVRISPQDLHEFYLFPFEASVREGRAASIMGAYNRLNGEPCCASATLLKRILREEWGFEGYVVSDCEAIRDIWEHHRVVDTPAEAAALAVRSGCELECGSEFPALIEAVEQQLISEDEIDQAVTRLLAARHRLGMFDPAEQVEYARIPFSVVGCQEHRELALEAARQSMVLLKNEAELLPLSKDVGTIAVIGPNADDARTLVGNYSGTPSDCVTPLEAIRQVAGDNTRILYEPGTPLAAGFPLLSPIPRSHLTPPDAAEGAHGLRGTYFSGPSFEGNPQRVQIDPEIDFNWKDTSPLSGEWGERFSVIWEGQLVPPVQGSYALGVHGANGYRLQLDDELIVEGSFIHHPILTSKRLELEADRPYRVRLEYSNRGLDPQVQLLWEPPDDRRQARALEAAAAADMVVMVLGLSAALESEEMPVELQGFSGGDRTEIGLPEAQEQLLREVHALGVPMALVLMNGSALAVTWASEHVPAILEAWYPGEAGGRAIAEVLFGAYNPGGKLPATFYRSVEDLPAFDDYALEGHTYRYFRGDPLYPFGYGLSYTDFELSNLGLDRQSLSAGEQVQVSVEVANRGARAGDEVVQLYAARPDSRSNKELKGFKRLTIAPGESRRVEFSLHAELLASYDNQGRAVLVPGKLKLLVGNSSDNLPLSAELEILGEAAPLKSRQVFETPVRVE